MARERKARNQNLTVPNALSVFRILLVPFFAWAFLKNKLLPAGILLALSGLSDCFDGLIARKFNQVTELGKMLDPLADKITQGVVAICLAVRVPEICPLLLLFAAKETAMLVCAVILLRRNKKPSAAQWYGKAATVLFYVSVGTIVLMHGILNVEGGVFTVVSWVLLAVTAVMMIYAGLRYFQIFLEILRSDDESHRIHLGEEIKAKTVREKSH